MVPREARHGTFNSLGSLLGTSDEFQCVNLMARETLQTSLNSGQAIRKDFNWHCLDGFVSPRTQAKAWTIP